MPRQRVSRSPSRFGEFLQARLVEADVTPAQFAASAGLSTSHVYQLLRGDRADPRSTTFHKVASALQMTDAALARAVYSLPALDEAATGLPRRVGRPTPVDTATFFGIMSAFPSGVTIVSTLDELGRPRGLTCTSTCSLSANPPLLLVCIDQRSLTLDALRQAGRFVVNYLLVGRGELANRFASRDPDRWANVAWRPTPSGLPWLHRDTLGYAECVVVQEVEGGDHVILVGRVDGGRAPAPGTQPLMYFRRGYGTWRD